MQDFAGIWVPLVTPFVNGAVYHEGLKRLVAHLRGSGVKGLVVGGSTGEAASLDEAEQLDMLRTVLEARGELQVMMGVSGVTPSRVVGRLQGLAGLPLAGVLVTPPYYVKPSQQGVVDFFTEVANASTHPVVLYDIPSRTGVRIETETMLRLAAHPRIRAIKDCGGDLEHTHAVIDDGRLQVLCGDDSRIFVSLCQGAVGVIAASAHLRPDLFVRLLRLIQQGDLHAARRLWKPLWPLTRALFEEPNPGPVKSALPRIVGVRDELRAPMTAASAGLALRIQGMLDAMKAAWPDA